VKIILYVLSVSIILFEGLGFCQDIRATTENGRKVILKEDGSWKFCNEAERSLAHKKDSYQKSDKSTGVFKAKGDKFLIWFDPLKWQQKKSADSDKPTFVYKDGDVYAIVLAERIAMTIEALKEFAIKNAKTVAPDIKVTYEEDRIVNGKKVLCMKMDGTIENIPFVYYGYYYSGKVGMVQLITYTSQNLFPEYEPEMTEFLNGMVINE
jgi:hypothetical protein